MISKSGRHKCEKCGYTYGWQATKLNPNEIVFGRVADISSQNVAYVDMDNDNNTVITVECPYCGYISNENLADK